MSDKIMKLELEYQHKLKLEGLKEVLAKNINLLKASLSDVKSKIIINSARTVIINKEDYEWLLERVETLIKDREERLEGI